MNDLAAKIAQPASFDDAVKEAEAETKDSMREGFTLLSRGNNGGGQRRV